MNLKGKIVTFLFIALTSAFTINAQTLYWVGGSGNFNDGKHWSFTSGGKTANIKPNENTDAVFDNNSSIDYIDIVISFVGENSCKSFLAQNTFFNLNLHSQNSATLHQFGNLLFNYRTNNYASFILILDSKDNSTKSFNPFRSTFKGDVIFKSGNWNLNSIYVDSPNSLIFEGGVYDFSNASIKSYNLLINKNKVIFNGNKTFITVSNNLDLSALKNNSGSLKVAANFSNTLKTKLNSDLKNISKQQFSALACTIHYSVTNAACAGSTGVISLTVDPSCAPGPFTVDYITGASCIPTQTTIPGPMVVTFTNISLCGANSLDIFISDASGAVISSSTGLALPVDPTPVNISVLTTTAPSCAGLCDGIQRVRFLGGASPYTVQVNPIGGPTFTTGAVTINTVTGLCGGVQTYSLTDSKGCVFIFNSFVAPTPPIILAVASASVNCNGFCSGTFSVIPSGGTPNYTINFSTGTNSLVSPAQTASIGGLCPALYTATITDIRGCTTTTNVNITQPSTISITPTQTNLACNGLCNGITSINVTGGTLPYAYVWSPGPGSTNSLTGLCAGTQTVTVTDNNLCIRQQTFNVTQPTSITITPTVTNILCNGLCTGSASVSAIGGTGPITFTWVAAGPSTISTSSSISGQCAGTFTIFARDGNLCTTSTVITITQPPALTLTALTQSVQCFGLCTGASTAFASGGSAPYSYTWSPGSPTGQGTATVTNLCLGNYTIAVTDGSNCPITRTLSITQPSSITLNPSTTSVTCNGLCNGAINVAPTGGIAPYTYTLLTPVGGTVIALPPFNGLCSGTYTVFVRDLSTCSQSFTVNVVQPNPLVPSVNSTSLTCFLVCNGSLAGSIAGGTPGYTLSWNTPTGLVAGGVIGGLCAGTYTFLANDFNGCTTSSIVTLTQPPQITATINVTNPLCNASCNGFANAGVGGGTPGYTLNWSNGFTGNPNLGLCAGNYTLNVIDNNGCARSFTTSLIAPPALTITVNTTSVSCAGSCDGSATVAAIGGSPGFTYQFNTLPFPTTNTTGILGGFCAGVYIASATDVNGCSQSIPFSINQPIALSLALTGLLTSCNACTGAGTVTPANGTPTYAVAWTNTLGITVSSSSIAVNLCPGNYTATATDSRGCVATLTTNVAQTVSVTVISSGGGIQCFGACTASAIANASGGTGAYTYTWAVSTQTTQTAVNLCAGNYTVTAADGLGCSNTSTITFVAPPAIIISPIQINATCFGNCNGSINSNASGGTGALTYSWSPGGQTTPNLLSLCAGTYTLRVTDANGCNIIQTFTITQSPAIAVTFTTTNPSACVVNNGSICATPSGGSGAGYAFTWSPAGGVGINTSCYSSLGAGSYSLIVSDGAGCTNTLSSLITNPTGPTLTINSQSITCFGANSGAISVTATGTPAFTFTWTPIVGFVNVGNTSTAINLVSGNYVISATDGLGCITSQSVAVLQAPSLTVTSAVTNVNCNSVCNGSITLVALGATPSFTYSWFPAASITAGQGTGTVSGLCAGNNYSVNVTDANSCLNTFTFNITQPPSLTITTTSANVNCNGACNGTISAFASGGTGLINYNWSPVGAFTGSTTSSIFNLCPNIYSVTATDANLCIVTRTFQITQPTALSSTLNLVNASCSNSCNAVATYTVVGGTPLYNFSWSSSGANTNTLGNLCAGNYTATVTDANGCVLATGFTVTVPAPFTSTLTPQNPLCNAACNGSIATTLSGAQGAVLFSWVPAGVGQNPTGLCANNYTLTATDAAGCQLLNTAVLTTPLALLANVTTSNPACNGNCNGIAISTPVNNQGSVNYTWTPPAPNSATVNALCAGNYTVLAQDANGCQDVQTFTLTNPPLINLNSSVGPSSCSFPNGSITVIAVGGTPGYTYTWGAPIVSTNSTVVGLAAGIYTVTVNDSQNCTNTLSIPLSNSNGPSAAPITSSSVNCNGQCTGAASINIVTIVGGTPGYTVAWVSPPSASTINPQINLCAGNYNAQITDANSCILFSGVTISQPAPINVLPNVGLPICNGICNGSISLNTSGGNGPYNYTWTPFAPNSATLINACAGNYTININDLNGCLSTQTLNLPPVLNMVATVNVTNNLCFTNCFGIANVVSIVGGIPPFNYSWNNGQSGGTANSLCNSTYSVIVTDANGCNNTFTSSITSPAQIIANTIVIQPLCGICNGASTVTPSGGTAPFTYTWTNGSNSTIANGLCGGLYQVTIQDFLGCQITQTVPVNNSSGITGNLQNITNETCFGNCNGAATVTAIGGTAPISYNWLGPIVSNSVITNLCGGTYFLQMTDAAGCVRNTSININSVSQLTLSPFITPPSTCGLSNGTINVTVSGGSPVYSYAWLPAGITSSLVNVGAGSYTLTVTDAGSCSQTQVFTISNVTGPLVSAIQANINCFNACTGSITANGTSTALPISYQWSNGSILPTVTGLCNGVITLTVTDGNLCRTIQSFTITENPQILIGAIAIQQPSCGLCNGGSTVSAIGGLAPYTYTWSSGALSPIANTLCAGLYNITINDILGCQITQTVPINNSNGITADVQTIINEQCFGNCNGSATVVALGGTAPISYSWLGPIVSNSVITGLCGGTYFLQMTDAVGCIRNTSVNINSATQLTLTPIISSPTACSVSNGSINVVVTGGTPGYNYLWTPSGVVTPFLNNIGPGSYTLMATESGSASCSQTQVFTISNITGPLVSVIQSNINCFNTCTGSITALGTSTALPISYQWSNGSISPTVSGLCNGVITLTVTDGNLCRTIASYTITENPPISIGAFASQQPACGLCNGGATVSALGGTAPYTYTWSSGSTAATANGLCAGLNQVTVDDVFGCQVTQTIILNNINGITSDIITITNEQCFASCNGAATVVAVGGTLPISYNWLSPAVSSNSIVTGLCGGSNYFLQMTDANGCIRNASVSINSAIQLTLTPTTIAPSCGFSNGTLNIAPSGGMPSYFYNWLPSGITTSSLTNIGVGSYTVIVTDNSPCSQTQVFNVSNTTGPLVSTLQSNIACFNACTGSITALGTSTALPVNYLWSNGSTSPSVTNLCKGVITLTVTDANGCSTITSYTITDNPAIAIGAIITQQPACNLCNGGSTVTALGIAPFTYNWTNGSAVNSATNLCAGLYQVLITDALGCNTTQNVNINNSSGITGQTINVQNEQCFGLCNGAATVTAIGGTAPITYSWVAPSSTNSSIGSLCAGNYFVQMTDAVGCIRSTSLAVGSAVQLTLTPFVVAPSCGVSNGTISVIASGGVPAYTYTWLPAGATTSLTNIGAGSYTLITIDSSPGGGCSATQVFNISNTNGPLVLSVQSNINCFNACTGSVTVSGTSTSVPVTYNWSTGSTAQTVASLCKGVVTVTVSAANGCLTITSFTITDNPDIQFSLPNLQLPLCSGNSNGTITLIPSGGVLPYTYSWTPIGGTINPISALPSGTYAAMVTDNRGCAKSQTVILTDPLIIAITSTLNNSSCSTIADGSVSVTATGGTPSYTFAWSGPASFTANTQNILNILSGTYSLNITDNNGCIQNTTLQVVPTITITADAGNNATVCPSPNSSITLTGTNSIGASAYNWYLLPNVTNTIANTATASVVPNAIGSSTYILQTVSSVSTCVAFDTIVINLFPISLVDAGPSYTIPVFSTVTIGGSPTSASGLTFSWSPSFNLDNGNVSNPVASNTVNTTFTVTSTDGNGCLVSDTMQVLIFPEIVIPNGFSPNGDGKNDKWLIDLISQFPANTVEVYNRWGELLFYSQGYTVPFDGKFKGKDLPVGTYYYIINLNHPAYTKPYTGPLTIFR